MRFHASWLAAALPLLLLSLPGCGGAADAPAVRGKITLDGQPLADAEVRFEPLANDPNLPGAVAKTTAEGMFDVPLNESTGETLPPGNYAVVVSKKVNAQGQAPSELEGDLEQLEAAGLLRETLPPRYSIRSETTLVAEIKPEPNQLQFDLRTN